jgi:hypothetical protein
MRILVFAVLLSVVQTTAPIPRQTPDNPASTNGNVQEKTKDKDTPTNPTPPLVNQDQSKTPNGDAKQQGTHDAEHSVAVSKLPPVTVLPTKRDWADWGYLAFSCLLVIVGALQIWLLQRQLRTIDRQTNIAEQQRTQMVQAGEQTERIINQMRDTAQRQLRAYVCVSSALLKFLRPEVPEIQVHFKNCGQTPAYELRGWIHIWVEEYPLKVLLPQPTEDLRKGVDILGPNRESIFVIAKDPPVPTQSLRLLGTMSGTIYVYGEIRYTDVFGEKRWTKYRLIYGGVLGARNRTVDGVVTALLNPDVEGNEAN